MHTPLQTILLNETVVKMAKITIIIIIIDIVSSSNSQARMLGGGGSSTPFCLH